MSVLQLIARKNFITFNKEIARKIGLHEALLLGELCSICDLFGEEFFFTQDKISNDTCLSEYQISKALKVLQDKGIITIRKKGIPCKNHYTLNERAILDLLGTSSLETRPLDPEKLDHLQQKNLTTISNNTEVIKQSNNTNIYRETTTTKKTTFQKPTVEEIKAYCEERKNNVDPQRFYDFYESKGWLVGKSKMKDWKASVRTWEKNSFSNSQQKNDFFNTDKIFF